MSKENLVKIMNELIANCHSLSVKTQNYHWNFTGPNFSSLHALFESQYNDLSSAIDDLAERIRALGFKTQAVVKFFNDQSVIVDGDHNYSAVKMLQDLAAGHAVIVDILKKALLVANDLSDDATADMIVERIMQHEKTLWMLNSTLAE